MGESDKNTVPLLPFGGRGDEENDQFVPVDGIALWIPVSVGVTNLAFSPTNSDVPYFT